MYCVSVYLCSVYPGVFVNLQNYIDHKTYIAYNNEEYQYNTYYKSNDIKAGFLTQVLLQRYLVVTLVKNVGTKT